MIKVYVLCLSVMLFIGNFVYSDVQFYDNQNAWSVFVADSQNLVFDKSTLEPILGRTLETGSDLGNPLELIQADTGLDASCIISADTSLIFWAYPSHSYGDMISIGGPSTTNDDWTLSFESEKDIYAVAVELVDSNEDPSEANTETLYVYGKNDILLGSISGDQSGFNWPAGSQGFIGIVSTEPIERISFDEAESGNDNIGLGQIWFATKDEYHVDIHNGQDSNNGFTRQTAFASIGKGTQISGYMDEIFVWPGTYNETVDFIGKAITVKSAADAAVITNPAGYGVRFHTAENAGSVLKNFVIRDCQVGIQAENTFPTIEHVTVVQNDQGIIADGIGDPAVSNSILWDNASGDLIDCDASHSWVSNELSGSIDGLVAYYPLDDNADDFSGNGYVGTENGNITHSSGLLGQAAMLDGVGDSVSGFGEPLFDDNFSASVWFNADTINNYEFDSIIGQPCSVNGHSRFLIDIKNSKLRITQHRSLSLPEGFSDTEINTGTWYHAVFVSDSNGIKGYLNGILEINIPSDDIYYSGTGNQGLTIGAWQWGAGNFDNFFDGKIDEVSLYNRALSSEEIQEIYSQNSSGKSIGDPFFADPDNNDFHLKSEKGRFYSETPSDPNMFGELDGLWAMDAVTSPCIDAGDPEDNPSAERKPNGGRVNMGAYGASAYASMSECPLKGDLNGDGIVDLADFAIFSENWLGIMPWIE